MGLTFFKTETKINFVGNRSKIYLLSGLLIAAICISTLMQGGIRYGIDFAGGAVVQVHFTDPIADATLKKALEATNIPGLSVQSFSNDGRAYLIRMAGTDLSTTQLRESFNRILNEKIPNNKFDVPRLEMVGPKVGADLRSKALEAMYYSILLVAVYISGRFENRWFTAAFMTGILALTMGGLEFAFGISKAWLILGAASATVLLCWRLKLVFALGTIVSMFHDVILTAGIFSLLGQEFDLTSIAALLTIVGYSLNDTIIVYDRIRENMQRANGERLSDLINTSINQTLSRTILTSGTTLLVITSLLLFGGTSIFAFALMMFIGVIVGTLSSIFVASPILLIFGDPIQIAQVEEPKIPHGVAQV